MNNNKKLIELRKKRDYLLATGDFTDNNGEGYSEADLELMYLNHEISKVEKQLKEKERKKSCVVEIPFFPFPFFGGQPAPHIVDLNEVKPGETADEYVKRKGLDK